MSEGNPWAAGLALAGGLLVLSSVVLVFLAFELPGLLLGVDADALRSSWSGHGPVAPRILLLLWAAVAGVLPVAGGLRMADGEPAEPRAGLAALAGGLLALPLLGGTFLGPQAAVLGGALHLTEARRQGA